MSLLDSMFDGSLPANREEMVAVCERKIAEGEYEEAARIAQMYKNRVSDSAELTEKQKAVDMGYAFFVIGKAVFKSIQANPTMRTYDYFKAFFAAHVAGYWFFQQVLLKDIDEWDEESEHYSYLKQLDSFYDGLYKAYGNNPELDRADTDANEIFSSARRGF